MRNSRSRFAAPQLISMTFKIIFRTTPKEKEKVIFQMGVSEPQVAVECAKMIEPFVAGWSTFLKFTNQVAIRYCTNSLNWQFSLNKVNVSFVIRLHTVHEWIFINNTNFENATILSQTQL